MFGRFAEGFRSLRPHFWDELDGELLPPQESLDQVKAWWTLRIVASLLKEPHVYEAQVPMRLGDKPFGAVRR